jgi:16S rRNA (cytosine1402-N4)-methyltransferase
MQLETADRGFSVIRDGPLDMRMSSLKCVEKLENICCRCFFKCLYNSQTLCSETDTITAANVVNKLSEEALAKIIWRYGEEKQYKKIARGICYYKSRFGDINTTKELADIISTVVKGFCLL